MLKIYKGIKTGVKYILNASFQEYVDEYNMPNHLRFRECGDYGYGEIIYLIGMEDLGGMEKHMGFFALFNCVLNRIYYADRLGLVPVVHYPQTVLYYDETMKQNQNNVFEYFFQPVSSIPYEKALKAKNLVISSEKDSQFNLCNKPGYLLDERGINNLANIAKKYIRFNDVTQSKLNEGLKLLDGTGKKLGVHIRGTDFKNKNKNHPIGITIEQYKEKIREIMFNGEYTCVFLATDEEAVIREIEEMDIFVKMKGKLLMYKDVFRSTNGLAVHKQEYNRLRHKYLLGFEVLRDMYTLAKCNGFIAGRSQVSLTVQIYKKMNNEQFDNICILDNGMQK
ncbi:MAG: O-fucosyltransferase family protein [Clostridia bacterium]|nr:O-fucosyltransferase family protein [Clostridia bacterium]